MSNLSDAVAGLKTILQNGITGLRAFDYPPDSISEFPAAVILLEGLDPRIAFGGNTFDATLRVVFLVRSGDDATGFQALYDYIDPTATSESLIKAVRDAPTLNATVDNSAVTRIERIGRRELWGGWYFGFDALIEFTKTVA